MPSSGRGTRVSPGAEAPGFGSPSPFQQLPVTAPSLALQAAGSSPLPAAARPQDGGAPRSHHVVGARRPAGSAAPALAQVPGVAHLPLPARGQPRLGAGQPPAAGPAQPAAHQEDQDLLRVSTGRAVPVPPGEAVPVPTHSQEPAPRRLRPFPPAARREPPLGPSSRASASSSRAPRATGSSRRRTAQRTSSSTCLSESARCRVTPGVLRVHPRAGAVLSP